jgi:lysophospholipase L1-like esterase
MVTGPILMIGDSITDAGRPRDTDGLGFGWVKLVADALYGRGVVLNRGIGGDRVADLRARWSHDVVALAPSVLTVLIGINDVAGRYGGAGPVPLGAFDADYRAILTQAFEAAAPGLILMEPFLACAVGDGKAVWHDDLDPKRKSLHGSPRSSPASSCPSRRWSTKHPCSTAHKRSPAMGSIPRLSERG